jgi:SAM-dependent methyltransferase
MKETTNVQSSRGWDRFWRGARESGSPSAAGVNHPGIAGFWRSVFKELIDDDSSATVLDLATGGGYVIRQLQRIAAFPLANVCCIDISAAAVASVRAEFPEINGIVADACAVPLQSGSFDLVTSQFGIEYAGIRAIDEAVRMLRSGGTIQCLMHIRSGGIVNESSATVDAIERLKKVDCIALAAAYFEAGFAAVRGADRAPYDHAGRQLNPAIHELESILSEHGAHVAGDTIAYLYSTIRSIHSGIQYYEPDEVLAWLDNMESELLQHQQRALSTIESSLGVDEIEAIGAAMTEAGLTVQVEDPLEVDDMKLPLAWSLRARRDN